MSEHFKTLLRQGRISQLPSRETLARLTESAAQMDSIRCPNCSNTVGVDPDPAKSQTYTVPADPIIDGPLDMEENDGQVQICPYCGYDLTDTIQGFYGEK